MNLFKKLFVPSGTREVIAVQTWTVRWESRFSDYSSGTKPEIEVFTDIDEAKVFKAALENAYKLIRHTSGTQVILQANQ